MLNIPLPHIPTDVLIQFAIFIGSGLIGWKVKTEISRYRRHRKLCRPLEPGESVGSRLVSLCPGEMSVTLPPGLSEEEARSLFDELRTRSGSFFSREIVEATIERLNQYPDVRVTVDSNMTPDDLQRLWDDFHSAPIPERPYLLLPEEREEARRHLEALRANYAVTDMDCPTASTKLELTKRRTCAYYSGNSHLKCAINPATPCVDCTDYQEK